MNRGYPTNPTDNQWQILQKILEPTTRKRKYALRDIVDCTLYINKTGCQWRMIPKDFPPYNLVFYYFTKWRREGVFEEKILADGGYRGDRLKETARKRLGCQFEVVLRPDEGPKKFNVIPLRWIVERSFAWLYNFRRVALDYEFYSESSEAMIQIAFSKIMLNKLSN